MAENIVDLYGINIIEDHNLVIKYQLKFPRSKRKRIRKKWSKQEKNFRTKPDMNYYLARGGVIICHPAAKAVLMKHINSASP